jgi:Asp-tRNA(Asn)/Glu-tRNA(Gln) amidotransferase A subunit family amidase
VADFHVPLALGTQTGGSMIRPASFCGVHAIKPTWNLVNRDGAKVYAVTLDTVGWFGRSVADLRLLYDVFDPQPAAPDEALHLEPARLRIAVCRSPVWNKADAATRDALASATRLLKAAGATVTELELPPPFEQLADLQHLIMRTEGRSAFLAEYRAHHDQLHESFREQVENRDGTTRAQLLHAYDTAALCRARFDAIAADYDAVLTPSVVGEAPVGLAATGDYVFNAMWTLLHVPCVNVPGCKGPNGLPVGLTLTGPRFSDRRVLAVAEAFSRLVV